MPDTLWGDLFDDEGQASGSTPAAVVEPATAAEEPTAAPVAEEPPKPKRGRKPKQAVAETLPAAADPPTLPGVKTGSNTVIFDIETGPEREEVLRDLFEFDPAKSKGYELIGTSFDPAAVKFGNMVDPLKRQAKVQAARETFEAAKAAAEAAMTTAQTEQWDAFVADAALSAVTGRVLAVGCAYGDNNGQVGFDIETDSKGEGWLLSHFWARFADAMHSQGRMVGFNCFTFDLPFLIHRSWLLDVEVPDDVLLGQNWHWVFLDLMKKWACGVYGVRIKLDRVAKFFGTARKIEGLTGADFARLYQGTPEQQEQALKYLKADLLATFDIAWRMGVM